MEKNRNGLPRFHRNVIYIKPVIPFPRLGMIMR